METFTEIISNKNEETVCDNDEETDMRGTLDSEEEKTNAPHFRNLPANLGSLGIDKALGDRPVWEVVKRPLPEKEKELLKAKKLKKAQEKAAKAKSEGETGDALTVVGSDDEEEEEETFHYYWRLTAGEAYLKAGAVGRHYRPIRFDPKTLVAPPKPRKKGAMEEEIATKFNAASINYLETNGKLHWILEDRWQECQPAGARPGSLPPNKLAIISPDFKKTGHYVNQMYIQPKDGKMPRRINFGEFRDLVTFWGKDTNLLIQAQNASTDPHLLTPAKGSFRYPIGTFVRSLHSAEDVPTIADSVEDNHTDRLYIKLRSSQAKNDNSGGKLTCDVVDVYLLKETVDKLAGMTAEDIPKRNSVNREGPDQPWGADNRQKSGGKTNTLKDTGSLWARNGQGFVFKYKYHGPTPETQHEFWNKIRLESIKSVESSRGWTRYIDPKIELFIVPVSPQVQLVEAIQKTLRELNMQPELFVKTEADKVEPDVYKLGNTRVGAAECAITRVHLLKASEVAGHDPKLQKLAISPFNHYETWITEAAYTSYTGARIDRIPPTKLQNQGALDTAMGLLKRSAKPAAFKNKQGMTTEDDEALKKRAEEMQKEEERWRYASINVSANKIISAIGKRSAAPNQITVMGCSASSIAKELGWADHNIKTAQSGSGNEWPALTHMPAEWLHRFAFSWGGLNKGDVNSSQHERNLIFGTGEANSVMTRYEKAWQAMVRKEADRLDPKTTNKKAPSGLGVKIGTLTTFADNLNPYPAKFGAGVASEKPKPLLKLPYWLCTSLVYTLNTETPVAPLGDKKSFQTIFYPWQRGFFTKFEQKLDEILLDRAYASYARCQLHNLGIMLATTSGEFGALMSKEPEKEEAMELEKDQAQDESIRDDVSEEERFTKDGYVEKDLSFQNNEGFQFDQLSEEEKFTKDGYDRNDLSFSKNDGMQSEQPKNEFEQEHYQDGNGQVQGGMQQEQLQEHEFDFHAASNQGPHSYSLMAMPQMTPADLWKKPQQALTDDAQTTSPPPVTSSDTQAFLESVNDLGPTAMDGISVNKAEIVVGDITGISSFSYGAVEALESADDPREIAARSITDTLAEPSSAVQKSSTAGLIPNFFAEDMGKVSSRKAAPRPKSSAPALAQKSRDTGKTQKGILTNKIPPAVITNAPEAYVVKYPFKLFGKHETELFALKDSRYPDLQYYRVKFPSNISFGAFMPTMANTPLDMIALCNTMVEYRSHGQRAGLTLQTGITLTGMLQPISDLLRDTFKQERPHIKFTANMGMISPKLGLMKPPQPLGFTLRGELPDITSPEIFGILTVTHVGIDVTGTRKGSQGGYDLGYSLFGRGRIGAVTLVGWRITSYGDKRWGVTITAQSEEWKNVAGIQGVNLRDVFLEAAWRGSQASTLRLTLRATFSIKEQATAMIQGRFGRNDIEVVGSLANCSLTTLKELYNQTFGGDIDVTTEHDIVIDSLVLVISRSAKNTSLSLHGVVSVDGHKAAEATIEIGAGCISFKGSITEDFTVGDVTIEEPALALSIYTSKSAETGRGFEVQFTGGVTVADKHKFAVGIYLAKTAGKPVQYTVYGAYDGDFYLHDLMPVLKDTNMLCDIRMLQLAVCVSNMKDPNKVVKRAPPGYTITEGVTIYAEVEIPALKDLLKLQENARLIAYASYKPPGEGGDGSALKIGIRVPNKDLFTIDRFAVGNLKLEVNILEGQPSIAVKGGLTFPINNTKTQTMELGLSASMHEARGEAQLTTDWVNPFDLNPAVTISQFKAGLGILYAGGTPSSVTLGGAVAIGKVKGSVIVHMGANPSQQLFCIKIHNLDVAQLTETVGNLMGVKDMKRPEGIEVFFIRKLEVYMSTGVELFDISYPRGVSLDVDMTLLGKRATLQAEVMEGRVKFKGSVQRFKIGELTVCAASGENKDPYVDIEITKDVQRIKIDGKVLFAKDNWVIAQFDIDSVKGTFDGYFELVIGDTLKILVIAKLEEKLSTSPQDRIEEVKEEKEGNAKSDLESKTEALVEKAAIDMIKKHAGPLAEGGLLQGKTLVVHAEVESKIIEYLVQVANENLSGERDPVKEASLSSNLNTAAKDLEAALVAYDTAKITCEEMVNKVITGSELALKRINEEITDSEILKATQLEQLEQNERTAILKAEQDGRDLFQRKQSESDAAQHAARDLSAQSEVQRARVKALEDAEQAVLTAREILSEAQIELAFAQTSLMDHNLARPKNGENDPQHEPWLWKSQELLAKVQKQEALVTEAKSGLEIAESGVTTLAMGSMEEATASLADLVAKTTISEQFAKKCQEAIGEHMKAAKTKERWQQDAFKRRHTELAAHWDKIIDRLGKKLVAEGLERKARVEAVRAKNNVDDTLDGKNYVKCLETFRAADAKARSYDQLRMAMAQESQALLDSLRFSVNVVGKASEELLTIKSIFIDGKISDKSGHVTARVVCKVGGFDYTFSLNIELGDIVSLFTELWTRIKAVISSVAKELLDVARKGIEEVKKFCEEAKTVYKQAEACAEEEFRELLREHQFEVQEFMEAIEPLRQLAEEAGKIPDKASQNITDEMRGSIEQSMRDGKPITEERLAENVKAGLLKTGQQVTQQVEEKIDRWAEEKARQAAEEAERLRNKGQEIGQELEEGFHNLTGGYLRPPW